MLVVIGYAGRDRAAVEAHIDELAELVVVMDGDETFVTPGSDHTDRVLEAVDIVASKGVCVGSGIPRRVSAG